MLQGDAGESMGDKRKMTSDMDSVYRAQSGSLTRFLRRFLDSSVDVEDVLQETFLKTFEAERKVHIRAPVPFLFKTARNLALNAISMRKRRKTDMIADVDEVPFLYDVDLISGLDPESHHAVRDQLSIAQDALDQLTPRVREVFILRKVYGLTHKEIGTKLGIKVSTVEKHVAAGIFQLKQIPGFSKGLSHMEAADKNLKKMGKGGLESK